jgi:hypothetical protein
MFVLALLTDLHAFWTKWYIEGFMRIINRIKNLWRVPQDFMNLAKSSWNSKWTSHYDHQLSQGFMKGYLTRFIKIMSCTKSLEGFARIINCTKDFERVCNNHQSYWEFMKENIQEIKWITNPFFNRFLKRYEKPFSLSITSKEFLRCWAEIFILWTWQCIREVYLNRPRIVEQLTDFSHYATVII